ncbi:3-oxo-5-alpha-steroid 4-dehydrogenase 2 isoform X1 [Protopterus annectens]|uniref:3-oxo-5alpha-steroid 4-dehydrogenase (NADP(+)) n=1 Tax=Protopterus annectens TaxID=7888 RepID=A0A2U9NKS5_PROAN|nr:3-oxo-5-alpha-steroid 4-dehydrogenase 2 isoform X1 [Protopterus annectens]AWT24658.1 SRD5A2 [Protopterus annectens]
MEECNESLVFYLYTFLGVGGVLYLLKQTTTLTPYGRYVSSLPGTGYIMLPAKLGWFLQELPAFLVPALMVGASGGIVTLNSKLPLLLFCGHYFQRTFIYSLLTRGRPVPLFIVISSVIFCSFNGFLQGYHLVFCTTYPESWLKDIRFILGLMIFLLGMTINIHSDYVLRNLRKPGETEYRIPRGGMFEYVSGANFFGEIVEWFGYAIAAWTVSAFAFAFFTVCSIGPRAYHHHRYYVKKFEDYPKSRKAVIPFIF